MEKARQIIDDNAELSDDRLANKVCFLSPRLLACPGFLVSGADQKNRAGERKRSGVRERE